MCDWLMKGIPRRRYPPTVPCMEGGGIIEEHGIMVTDHPLVLWDGWCGEWKAKEDE